MNNYIRYYGQENSQIANSWQSVNCSNRSLFPEIEENEEELYEDEKNRRVIWRDSLFEDPEMFYRQDIDEAPPDAYPWTHQNWLKAGECSREPEQGTSAQPMNHLQENLATALSQPVQMTKAESMMQKMGWRGGALGRTGDGIVEPIAPNAIYATKTRGLGQPVERPPPKKKARPVYKEYNMEHFNTNTLLHILEFVKNDKEIEVVFDPKLFKYERKTIHNMVNDVINNEDLVAINFDSVAQMDIVGNIHKHNNYVLCSQSEGETPNRMLCLYKEAPEHVYLVTPNDIKDELAEKPQEETAIKDGTSVEKESVTESGTKHVEVKQNETMVANTVKQVDKADITVKPANKSAISVKEDTKTQNDLKQDVKSEKTAKPKRKNTNKGKQQNRNVNNVKQDAKTVNNVKQDAKSVNNVKHDDKQEVAAKTENEEDENPFLKSITRILKNNKDAEESMSKEFEKECTIVPKDAIDKIIEFFKEFVDNDVFTQFRFLGPFDCEAINRINEFINNVYSCITMKTCSDTKYDAVLRCLCKDGVTFEVKEDCNGSPVIYKYTRQCVKQ